MINNIDWQQKKDVVFPEIFYLGFVLLLSALTLSHTLFIDFFPKIMLPVLRIICYFILLLFILLNSKLYSFTLQKFILYIAFIFLSLISFYYSHAYYLLDLLVLGTASMIIDFKSILKIYLIVQVTFTVITFLGYLVNVFPVQDFGARINLFGEVSRRKSLGFRYTTLGVQLFFYVNLAYWYLRRRSITIAEISALLLLNLYLYNETGTRNAFLLITLEAILLFFLHFGDNSMLQKWMDHKWLQYIFLIIFAISYYIGANYNSSNSFYIMVNTVTSGRANLTHTAFQMFPARLFGTNLYTQYQDYLNAYSLNLAASFLDSSYMQMLFNVGILYTAAFLGLLTWLLKHAMRSSDFYLVIIMIFIAVHSSMDPQLFEFSYNIFILLIFRYFIENKSLTFKGDI